MIESAEEFKRLRESEITEEYTRASQDEASEQTWIDIIEKYPEMKIWVIHNKTVPLSILEILAKDKMLPSERVLQKRESSRLVCSTCLHLMRITPFGTKLD